MTDCVRRGVLQLPAAPRPAAVPEPQPLYDAELHVQMQADIAHLCGLAEPSILGTNNNGREAYRRRTPSILTAEDAALERDPAYFAQMRVRKAELQAQAVLLRAQASDLEVASAAD